MALVNVVVPELRIPRQPWELVVFLRRLCTSTAMVEAAEAAERGGNERVYIRILDERHNAKIYEN